MNLAELIDSLGQYRGDLNKDVSVGCGLSYNGDSVYLEWSLTFRRNTRAGAYRQYSAVAQRANAHIESISKKYEKLFDIKLKLCTLESCRESDDRADSNGDNPYSEYEQSIGGSVIFHPK